MASGATVRDRKKEFSWRRNVKAQGDGGLTVAAYCRRHSLREYGFYWWRRELARRDAVPAAFVPVWVSRELLPAIGDADLELIGQLFAVECQADEQNLSADDHLANSTPGCRIAGRPVRRPMRATTRRPSNCLFFLPPCQRSPPGRRTRRVLTHQ